MPGPEPLDLWTLLKRRNTSFEQWCSSEGIETYKDFLKMKEIYESTHVYYFSSPMLEEAKNKLLSKKVSTEQPTEEIVLPKKKLKKVALQEIKDEVFLEPDNVEIETTEQQVADVVDSLSTKSNNLGETSDDSSNKK